MTFSIDKDLISKNVKGKKVFIIKLAKDIESK